MTCFNNKRWKIATNTAFVVLIVMLLLPPTRSIVLSGVAGLRSWILPLRINDPGIPLGEADLNWKLYDLSGKEYTFSDFHGESIFLNQWATWCPPCRAEMPSIEKLYRKMGNKFRFIILTSDDQQKVKAFLQREGYTFPVFFGKISGQALATRTIPATTIIDSDGIIRIQKAGAYNWNARKVRKRFRSFE